MRLASVVLSVGVLTFLMVMLVQGDGPGSQEMLFGISRQHGVNAGDLPVFCAWLVGVVASVTLYWRR